MRIKTTLGRMARSPTPRATSVTPRIAAHDSANSPRRNGFIPETPPQIANSPSSNVTPVRANARAPSTVAPELPALPLPRPEAPRSAARHVPKCCYNQGMKHLVLVRHGESQLNVVNQQTRVYCGQIDTQLTDFGRRQAIEAGRHLARMDHLN